jgi:alpha-1,6-mannosyltransferase
LPPLHIVFGMVLLLAPVVNPWYLLWGLPSALAARATWPWTASFALLLSYATGENLGHPALDPFAVHPLAYWLQWSVIIRAIGIDIRRYRFTT